MTHSNYLLLILILTSVNNHGLVKSQQPTTYSPVLAKILNVFDSVTSDKKLLEVTFEVLQGICVCMQENVRLKEMNLYNGNDLDEHVSPVNEIGTTWKEIELFKRIYNHTCNNLRQELARKINGTISLDSEQKWDVTKCGQNFELTTEKLIDLTTVSAPQQKVKTQMRRILHKALVQTRKNHKYFMTRRALFTKTFHHAYDNSRQSIIIILTFNPKRNKKQNKQKNLKANEKEISDDLVMNSTINIDIFDGSFDFEKTGSDKQDFKTVSDCMIQSVYAFVMESEKNKETKTFKLLQKNGKFKIYIEISTEKKFDDYFDLCCNLNTANPFCLSIPTSYNKKLTENYLGKPSSINTFNLLNNDYVSKIMNLVKLYKNESAPEIQVSDLKAHTPQSESSIGNRHINISSLVAPELKSVDKTKYKTNPSLLFIKNNIVKPTAKPSAKTITEDGVSTHGLRQTHTEAQKQLSSELTLSTRVHKKVKSNKKIIISDGLQTDKTIATEPVSSIIENSKTKRTNIPNTLNILSTNAIVTIDDIAKRKELDKVISSDVQSNPIHSTTLIKPEEVGTESPHQDITDNKTSSSKSSQKYIIGVDHLDTRNWKNKTNVLKYMNNTDRATINDTIKSDLHYSQQNSEFLNKPNILQSDKTKSSVTSKINDSMHQSKKQVITMSKNITETNGNTSVELNRAKTASAFPPKVLDKFVTRETKQNFTMNTQSIEENYVTIPTDHQSKPQLNNTMTHKLPTANFVTNLIDIGVITKYETPLSANKNTTKDSIEILITSSLPNTNRLYSTSQNMKQTFDNDNERSTESVPQDPAYLWTSSLEKTISTMISNSIFTSSEDNTAASNSEFQNNKLGNKYNILHNTITTDTKSSVIKISNKTIPSTSQFPKTPKKLIPVELTTKKYVDIDSTISTLSSIKPAYFMTQEITQYPTDRNYINKAFTTSPDYISLPKLKEINPTQTMAKKSFYQKDKTQSYFTFTENFTKYKYNNTTELENSAYQSKDTENMNTRATLAYNQYNDKREPSTTSSLLVTDQEFSTAQEGNANDANKIIILPRLTENPSLSWDSKNIIFKSPQTTTVSNTTPKFFEPTTVSKTIPLQTGILEKTEGDISFSQRFLEYTELYSTPESVTKLSKSPHVVNYENGLRNDEMKSVITDKTIISSVLSDNLTNEIKLKTEATRANSAAIFSDSQFVTINLNQTTKASDSLDFTKQQNQLLLSAENDTWNDVIIPDHTDYQLLYQPAKKLSHDTIEKEYSAYQSKDTENSKATSAFNQYNDVREPSTSSISLAPFPKLSTSQEVTTSFSKKNDTNKTVTLPHLAENPSISHHSKNKYLKSPKTAAASNSVGIFFEQSIDRKTEPTNQNVTGVDSKLKIPTQAGILKNTKIYTSYSVRSLQYSPNSTPEPVTPFSKSLYVVNYANRLSTDKMKRVPSDKTIFSNVIENELEMITEATTTKSVEVFPDSQFKTNNLNQATKSSDSLAIDLDIKTQERELLPSDENNAWNDFIIPDHTDQQSIPQLVKEFSYDATEQENSTSQPKDNLSENSESISEYNHYTDVREPNTPSSPIATGPDFSTSQEMTTLFSNENDTKNIVTLLNLAENSSIFQHSKNMFLESPKTATVTNSTGIFFEQTTVIKTESTTQNVTDVGSQLTFPMQASVMEHTESGTSYSQRSLNYPELYLTPESVTPTSMFTYAANYTNEELSTNGMKRVISDKSMLSSVFTEVLENEIELVTEATTAKSSAMISDTQFTTNNLNQTPKASNSVVMDFYFKTQERVLLLSTENDTLNDVITPDDTDHYSISQLEKEFSYDTTEQENWVYRSTNMENMNSKATSAFNQYNDVRETNTLSSSLVPSPKISTSQEVTISFSNKNNTNNSFTLPHLAQNPSISQHSKNKSLKSPNTTTVLNSTQNFFEHTAVRKTESTTQNEAAVDSELKIREKTGILENNGSDTSNSERSVKYQEIYSTPESVTPFSKSPYVENQANGLPTDQMKSVVSDKTINSSVFSDVIQNEIELMTEVTTAKSKAILLNSQFTKKYLSQITKSLDTLAMDVDFKTQERELLLAAENGTWNDVVIPDHSNHQSFSQREKMFKYIIEQQNSANNDVSEPGTSPTILVTDLDYSTSQELEKAPKTATVTNTSGYFFEETTVRKTDLNNQNKTGAGSKLKLSMQTDILGITGSDTSYSQRSLEYPELYSTPDSVTPSSMFTYAANYTNEEWSTKAMKRVISEKTIISSVFTDVLENEIELVTEAMTTKSAAMIADSQFATNNLNQTTKASDSLVTEVDYKIQEIVPLLSAENVSWNDVIIPDHTYHQSTYQLEQELSYDKTEQANSIYQSPNEENVTNDATLTYYQQTDVKKASTSSSFLVPDPDFSTSQEVTKLFSYKNATNNSFIFPHLAVHLSESQHLKNKSPKSPKSATVSNSTQIFFEQTTLRKTESTTQNEVAVDSDLKIPMETGILENNGSDTSYSERSLKYSELYSSPQLVTQLSKYPHVVNYANGLHTNEIKSVLSDKTIVTSVFTDVTQNDIELMTEATSEKSDSQFTNNNFNQTETELNLSAENDTWNDVIIPDDTGQLSISQLEKELFYNSLASVIQVTSSKIVSFSKENTNTILDSQINNTRNEWNSYTNTITEGQIVDTISKATESDNEVANKYRLKNIPTSPINKPFHTMTQERKQSTSAKVHNTKYKSTVPLREIEALESSTKAIIVNYNITDPETSTVSSLDFQTSDLKKDLYLRLSKTTEGSTTKLLTHKMNFDEVTLNNITHRHNETMRQQNDTDTMKLKSMLIDHYVEENLLIYNDTEKETDSEIFGNTATQRKLFTNPVSYSMNTQSNSVENTSFADIHSSMSLVPDDTKQMFNKEALFDSNEIVVDDLDSYLNNTSYEFYDSTKEPQVVLNTKGQDHNYAISQDYKQTNTVHMASEAHRQEMDTEKYTTNYSEHMTAHLSTPIEKNTSTSNNRTMRTHNLVTTGLVSEMLGTMGTDTSKTPTTLNDTINKDNLNPQLIVNSQNSSEVKFTSAFYDFSTTLEDPHKNYTLVKLNSTSYNTVNKDTQKTILKYTAKQKKCSSIIENNYENDYHDVYEGKDISEIKIKNEPDDSAVILTSLDEGTANTIDTNKTVKNLITKGNFALLNSTGIVAKYLRTESYDLHASIEDLEEDFETVVVQNYIPENKTTRKQKKNSSTLGIPANTTNIKPKSKETTTQRFYFRNSTGILETNFPTDLNSYLQKTVQNIDSNFFVSKYSTTAIQDNTAEKSAKLGVRLNTFLPDVNSDIIKRQKTEINSLEEHDDTLSTSYQPDGNFSMKLQKYISKYGLTSTQSSVKKKTAFKFRGSVGKTTKHPTSNGMLRGETLNCYSSENSKENLETIFMVNSDGNPNISQDKYTKSMSTDMGRKFTQPVKTTKRKNKEWSLEYKIQSSLEMITEKPTLKNRTNKETDHLSSLQNSKEMSVTKKHDNLLSSQAVDTKCTPTDIIRNDEETSLEYKKITTSFNSESDTNPPSSQEVNSNTHMAQAETITVGNREKTNSDFKVLITMDADKKKPKLQGTVSEKNPKSLPTESSKGISASNFTPSSLYNTTRSNILNLNSEFGISKTKSPENTESDIEVQSILTKKATKTLEKVKISKKCQKSLNKRFTTIPYDYLPMNVMTNKPKLKATMGEKSHTLLPIKFLPIGSSKATSALGFTSLSLNDTTLTGIPTEFISKKQSLEKTESDFEIQSTVMKKTTNTIENVNFEGFENSHKITDVSFTTMSYDYLPMNAMTINPKLKDITREKSHKYLYIESSKETTALDFTSLSLNNTTPTEIPNRNSEFISNTQSLEKIESHFDLPSTVVKKATNSIEGVNWEESENIHKFSAISLKTVPYDYLPITGITKEPKLKDTMNEKSHKYLPSESSKATSALDFTSLSLNDTTLTDIPKGFISKTQSLEKTESDIELQSTVMKKASNSIENLDSEAFEPSHKFSDISFKTLPNDYLPMNAVTKKPKLKVTISEKSKMYLSIENSKATSALDFSSLSLNDTSPTHIPYRNSEFILNTQKLEKTESDFDLRSTVMKQVKKGTENVDSERLEHSHKFSDISSITISNDYLPMDAITKKPKLKDTTREKSHKFLSIESNKSTSALDFTLLSLNDTTPTHMPNRNPEFISKTQIFVKTDSDFKVQNTVMKKSTKSMENLDPEGFKRSHKCSDLSSTTIPYDYLPMNGMKKHPNLKDTTREKSHKFLSIESSEATSALDFTSLSPNDNTPTDISNRNSEFVSNSQSLEKSESDFEVQSTVMIKAKKVKEIVDSEGFEYSHKFSDIRSATISDDYLPMNAVTKKPKLKYTMREKIHKFLSIESSKAISELDFTFLSVNDTTSTDMPNRNSEFISKTQSLEKTDSDFELQNTLIKKATKPMENVDSEGLENSHKFSDISSTTISYDYLPINAITKKRNLKDTTREKSHKFSSIESSKVTSAVEFTSLSLNDTTSTDMPNRNSERISKTQSLEKTDSAFELQNTVMKKATESMENVDPEGFEHSHKFSDISSATISYEYLPMNAMTKKPKPKYTTREKSHKFLPIESSKATSASGFTSLSLNNTTTTDIPNRNSKFITKTQIFEKFESDFEVPSTVMKKATNSLDNVDLEGFENGHKYSDISFSTIPYNYLPMNGMSKKPKLKDTTREKIHKYLPIDSSKATSALDFTSLSLNDTTLTDIPKDFISKTQILEKSDSDFEVQSTFMKTATKPMENVDSEVLESSYKLSDIGSTTISYDYLPMHAMTTKPQLKDTKSGKIHKYLPIESSETTFPLDFTSLSENDTVPTEILNQNSEFISKTQSLEKTGSDFKVQNTVMKNAINSMEKWDLEEFETIHKYSDISFKTVPYAYLPMNKVTKNPNLKGTIGKKSHKFLPIDSIKVKSALDFPSLSLNDTTATKIPNLNSEFVSKTQNLKKTESDFEVHSTVMKNATNSMENVDLVGFENSHILSDKRFTTISYDYLPMNAVTKKPKLKDTMREKSHKFLPIESNKATSALHSTSLTLNVATPSDIPNRNKEFISETQVFENSGSDFEIQSTVMKNATKIIENLNSEGFENRHTFSGISFTTISYDYLLMNAMSKMPKFKDTTRENSHKFLSIERSKATSALDFTSLSLNDTTPTDISNRNSEFISNTQSLEKSETSFEVQSTVMKKATNSMEYVDSKVFKNSHTFSDITSTTISYDDLPTNTMAKKPKSKDTTREISHKFLSIERSKATSALDFTSLSLNDTTPTDISNRNSEFISNTQSLEKSETSFEVQSTVMKKATNSMEYVDSKVFKNSHTFSDITSTTISYDDLPTKTMAKKPKFKDTTREKSPKFLSIERSKVTSALDFTSLSLNDNTPTDISNRNSAFISNSQSLEKSETGFEVQSTVMKKATKSIENVDSEGFEYSPKFSYNIFTTISYDYLPMNAVTKKPKLKDTTREKSSKFLTIESNKATSAVEFTSLFLNNTTPTDMLKQNSEFGISKTLSLEKSMSTSEPQSTVTKVSTKNIENVDFELQENSQKFSDISFTTIPYDYLPMQAMTEKPTLKVTRTEKIHESLPNESIKMISALNFTSFYLSNTTPIDIQESKSEFGILKTQFPNKYESDFDLQGTVMKKATKILENVGSEHIENNQKFSNKSLTTISYDFRPTSQELNIHSIPILLEKPFSKHEIMTIPSHDNTSLKYEPQNITKSIVAKSTRISSELPPKVADNKTNINENNNSFENMPHYGTTESDFILHTFMFEIDVNCENLKENSNKNDTAKINVNSSNLHKTDENFASTEIKTTIVEREQNYVSKFKNYTENTSREILETNSKIYDTLPTLQAGTKSISIDVKNHVLKYETTSAKYYDNTRSDKELLGTMNNITKNLATENIITKSTYFIDPKNYVTNDSNIKSYDKFNPKHIKSIDHLREKDNSNQYFKHKNLKAVTTYNSKKILITTSKNNEIIGIPQDSQMPNFSSRMTINEMNNNCSKYHFSTTTKVPRMEKNQPSVLELNVTDKKYLQEDNFEHSTNTNKANILRTTVKTMRVSSAVPTLDGTEGNRLRTNIPVPRENITQINDSNMYTIPCKSNGILNQFQLSNDNSVTSTNSSIQPKKEAVKHVQLFNDNRVSPSNDSNKQNGNRVDLQSKKHVVNNKLRKHEKTNISNLELDANKNTLYVPTISFKTTTKLEQKILPSKSNVRNYAQNQSAYKYTNFWTLDTEYTTTQPNNNSPYIENKNDIISTQRRKMMNISSTSTIKATKSHLQTISGLKSLSLKSKNTKLFQMNYRIKPTTHFEDKINTKGSVSKLKPTNKLLTSTAYPNLKNKHTIIYNSFGPTPREADDLYLTPIPFYPFLYPLYKVTRLPAMIPRMKQKQLDKHVIDNKTAMVFTNSKNDEHNKSNINICKEITQMRNKTMKEKDRLLKERNCTKDFIFVKKQDSEESRRLKGRHRPLVKILGKWKKDNSISKKSTISLHLAQTKMSRAMGKTTENTFKYTTSASKINLNKKNIFLIGEKYVLLGNSLYNKENNDDNRRSGTDTNNTESNGSNQIHRYFNKYNNFQQIIPDLNSINSTTKKYVVPFVEDFTKKNLSVKLDNLKTYLKSKKKPIPLWIGHSFEDIRAQNNLTNSNRRNMNQEIIKISLYKNKAFENPTTNTNKINQRNGDNGNVYNWDGSNQRNHQDLLGNKSSDGNSVIDSLMNSKNQFMAITTTTKFDRVPKYISRPLLLTTPIVKVTDWWLDDMYLKIRLPLPINSNPGMVFPSRRFAKMEEVADLGALFIDDLLDYKEMLDRGELPLERATSREKGQPLCMEQFYRLLGVCRVPEVGKDRLELPPVRQGEGEELVIVACRNSFYPIPVKAADRGRLTAGEIQAQLLHAMVDAAGAPAAPKVGLLTAMDRDQWARAREVLIKDENNRTNLELISRALCILCLDEAGGDLADDPDTSSMLRAMHGAGTQYHSANRWFDKTVQLIISSDGTVGMCYEHSAAEGVAVVRLAERALARAEVSERPSPPPALLPAPQVMKWHLTQEIHRTIQMAGKELDRNIADLDFKVYTYKGYGREFMKSCKTSPDVYIQLALQYAYYKMYGFLVSTYESASLRRFRNARVDNIRSAHKEAKAWAAAMCTAEASPMNEGDDAQKKVSFNLYGEQKKLELFEEAARKQTAIMEATIQGHGIDNHLLGLREAARETLGELPSLFTDSTYKQMIEFKLSTSQVTTTTEGTFMGYGAVVPDGYGVCYNPKKESIIFCIASFVSSSVTNTEAYRQSLEEALDSMKLMFQNRQVEIK